MREQLIQYVNLLFAGAPDSEEMRQEILQNTLDRYDDLVAQGKSPEAAYRLAISGIGDINELLGSVPDAATAPQYKYHNMSDSKEEQDSPLKRLLRACAVGLYILSPVPLFVLSELGMETLGLCGTLALVAVATVLIILGKRDEKDCEEEEIPTPRQELNHAIRSAIGVLTLAVYLILSFATGAWYITWIIFPLSACVKGLVKAILDLKEVMEHEN